MIFLARSGSEHSGSPKFPEELEVAGGRWKWQEAVNHKCTSAALQRLSYLPIWYEPFLRAMVTSKAQREQTELRRKLYTGRARAANGRGGNKIPEADLVPLWWDFLDKETTPTASNRPKLCLADVQDLLEKSETPRFNTLMPRTLSERELIKIKEWLDKAHKKQEARQWRVKIKEWLDKAHKKVSWNVLTEDAKSDADRLQIPRSVFDRGRTGAVQGPYRG